MRLSRLILMTQNDDEDEETAEVSRSDEDFNESIQGNWNNVDDHKLVAKSWLKVKNRPKEMNADESTQSVTQNDHDIIKLKSGWWFKVVWW